MGVYDCHPCSAGFFSPSPWGKNLCLRSSKQGTRIPIYWWKLTFLQGNDPQPFSLESQLSLSLSLSLMYSLSSLFPYVCFIILVFPQPAYRHRAFHRKRQGIHFDCGLQKDIADVVALWQLAQNLPCHNVIAEI